MAEKAKSAGKWLSALDCAGNNPDYKSWVERGKKIVRRYRDERELAELGSSRFNILWSNTETILPAVFSRTPKAEVARRNKDADPIARTAARILERALQYEIDEYPDYEDGLKGALLDRLLPGQGTVWLRFEQYGDDAPSVDSAEQADNADVQAGEVYENPIPEPAPAAQVKERSCVDYVYWEDFRYGESRSWADVPWVARREYLTRDEGVKRFGPGFKKVPLTKEPLGVDEGMRNKGYADQIKKAAVWEIWDRPSKQVIWVAEGFDSILDEKDDIFGLECFFPCPKPLFATQTTDQIIPVPDYVMYQDQATEIDLLTTRINGLTQSLKLNGAYDAANRELANILSAGDNTLVPVENWANLSEKGGVGGVISWVPLKEVVAALQAAWEAREQAKQVVYEITGISDIIRGATEAIETARAQDIKRQFGSLRLITRQRDFTRFASEILRIKAQLMMDVYSPETLIAMSGIMDTEDGQYAQQALLMMQAEPLREYKITVAADSLVAMDEEQEKSQRMEFIQAIGSYIQNAMAAAQQMPEIAPLAMSLMMFAVRAFPAAKPVESAFEDFEAALRNKPPQDPNAGANQVEMAKLQSQMQIKQMELQQAQQHKMLELQADAHANQIRAQADIQIQQVRIQSQAQLEQARAHMQAEMDRYKADLEAGNKAQIAAMEQSFQRWKAELDASVKIEVANISSKAKIQDAATDTATKEIASEVTQ
jgi:hypothetical protein